MPYGGLRRPVALDLDDLAGRRPLCTAWFSARTPCRAEAAIPLHAGGHSPFATLDLFTSDFTSDPKISDRLNSVELDEQIAVPAAARRPGHRQSTTAESVGFTETECFMRIHAARLMLGVNSDGCWGACICEQRIGKDSPS